MSAIAAWWGAQALRQNAVAVVLAAPTVLPIGDTFTDADSTALTSHTPTGANPGASWTSVVGTVPVVRNNEVYDATHTINLKTAVLNASGAYGTNDYTVAGAMRFAGDPGGGPMTNYVLGRCGATRSGYVWGYSYSGARWELLKLGAASDGTGDTVLGSSAATYASLTTTTPAFSLVMSGTTITGKVAGSTLVTVTDATFSTGKAGVALQDFTANNTNFGFYLDTLTVVTP